MILPITVIPFCLASSKAEVVGILLVTTTGIFAPIHFNIISVEILPVEIIALFSKS